MGSMESRSTLASLRTAVKGLESAKLHEACISAEVMQSSGPGPVARCWTRDRRLEEAVILRLRDYLYITMTLAF